jgi:hypothetical protein
MAWGVTRDPLSGAIQRNQQATGRTLYGPGRGAAATRGPVDAAGYEEREARKKARKRVEQRRYAMMAGASAPLGGAAFGAGRGFSR